MNMTTNQKSNDSLSRMMRGLQLLEQGIKIFENKNESFSMSSLTKNAVIYVIKGVVNETRSTNYKS